MDIRVLKRIDVRSPIMIAGWPGMGNVALGAVDFLRRKLNCEKFAEVDISDVFTHDYVEVENGVTFKAPPPMNSFYYRKNPDIILFESNIQLRSKDGENFLNLILSFAKEMKVRMIMTGAAFPQLNQTFEDPSVVYAVANSEYLRNLLYDKYKIRIMEGGHIRGMNGLIIGYARDWDIDAACFLATMPQFAIEIPNPKASKAVVLTMSKIIGITIDTYELDMQIESLEKEFKSLKEKFSQFVKRPQEPEAIPEEKETETYEEEDVPKEVIERIEKLFEEAKKDRSKAYILKKELDKWNLFKKYEDRFLDLFKEDKS